MRLLVVDDNSLLREQMAIYLRRKDHEVVTAGDGRQALEALDQERFDACITDYKMHGMNGLDLITTIEQHHPSTHVLLMTGSGTVQLATMALSRGAYEVFHKPFQMDRVMAVLKRIEEQSGGGGNGSKAV